MLIAPQSPLEPEIGLRPIQSTPWRERYLGLMVGSLVIAVSSRWWIGVQLAIASETRESFAPPWLMRHDPYAIALITMGLLGITVLGPFAPAAWNRRRWPTLAWFASVLTLSALYGIIAQETELAWAGLDGLGKGPG